MLCGASSHLDILPSGNTQSFSIKDYRNNICFPFFKSNQSNVSSWFLVGCMLKALYAIPTVCGSEDLYIQAFRGSEKRLP